MKKRIFIMLVLIFIVSSFVWSGGNKEDTGGKVAINTMLASHPWREVLTRNIGKFESAVPGVKIRMEVIPDDVFYERAILELTSKSGSVDVIADVVEWVPAYAGTGDVEPLDEYIEKYGGIEIEQMIPAVKNAHLWDGKQYSIPMNCGSRMFYYRKDLLADNGLTVPKSWEELRDAAKRMTTDADGDGTPETYGMSMAARKGLLVVLNWIPYLWAAGGHEWNDNHEITVNDEAGIAALKLWEDMISDESTPPAMLNYGFTENRSAFARGQIAMVSFGTSNMRYFCDPDFNPYADNVGYGLYPTRYENTQRTATAVLGGWGLVMSKSSRHKKEAYQFIAWATNKENDKDIAIEIAQGAYPDSYTQEDVIKKYPPLPYVLETLEGAQVLYKIAEGAQLMDILSAELSSALAGQKETKEALDSAAEKMTKVLKDAGYVK